MTGRMATPGRQETEARLERLCVLLADEDPAVEWRDDEAPALWALAAAHGVEPLVADTLRRRRDVPAAVRADAVSRVQRFAALDLERELELRRVLDALAAAGVRATLIKGAALAYTHYPRPELRTRLDTDVLIDASDRETVDATLGALGYVGDTPASAELVMYQRSYARAAAVPVVHVVDVHWRLANPHAFRDLPGVDEIAAGSRPIPRLGPAARAAGDVHALLIGCVHRVAHHFDDPRLIWLYDLHRIGRDLTADEWRAFAMLARDRGMAAVCLASLRQAAARFATPVPAGVFDALAAGRRGRERSAAWLAAPAPARTLVADLASMRGWGARWRLVHAYAFPPADYMHRVYAPASAMPLPWLYAARWVRGARRWLRPAS